MKLNGLKWLAALLLLIATQTWAKDDWPGWRGPNGNGIAESDQQPPTEWSESKNIVWKSPIPGRGHSSPTVFGDRIVLTSADAKTQTQSVLCFDRKTGKSLWTTKISQGGFPGSIHNNNTHATPTVAFDGERLYATFYHNEIVQLVALTPDGKIVWDKKAGAYAPNAYKYGYAPSPILYRGNVIVASEFDGPSYITAFDGKTGREVWTTSRPSNISYSTPIVAKVAGRDQMVISGADKVVSFDPANGKQLWSAAGIAAATCGTAVWTDNMFFASGGYPKAETVAVMADGSGRVAWRNGTKCYEQSMLAYEGHIYAVADTGVAFCWDAKTGEEKWKTRLGTKCSSSPILAGGNIYITTERGVTNVFKADPAKFQLVATNQLGDEMFATPAFCGQQIFERVASSKGGARQEMLYCIGK